MPGRLQRFRRTAGLIHSKPSFIAMKKNTTRFFSALAVTAAVFSATAGSQVMQKLGGNTSKLKSVAVSVTDQGTGIKPTKFMQQINIRRATTSSQLKSVKQGGLALEKQKQVKFKENAQVPELRGALTFHDDWKATQEAEPAIVALPKTATGDYTEIIPLEATPSYGFVEVEGIGYGTDYVNLGFFAFMSTTCYDMNTGEVVGEFMPQDMSALAIDIATDPTSGQVYGITYDDEASGLQLSKMEFTTSSITSTAVAALDGNWNSLAIDGQGQMYAIDGAGSLFKVDKATGATTLVGATGQEPYYLSSSAIDPKTGKMYWTLNPADESGYLCEVDLTTGAASILFQLPGNAEIQSLYVPTAAAEDGAPAEATDLAASFPEGALTGTVSFKAPATTYDGKAATGALTYEVLANGISVATGSTTFGADVAANVTVESAGAYTIVVTTKNSVGLSPKAKIKTFIGNGIPVAPKATLAYAGGNMNLTWDAVTTSADGGYINPAEVTYTVTRFPDAKVVATDTKGTSFSEAIAEPASSTVAYHYTVVAKFKEATSAPGVSNTVVLGTITPPYENTFDEETALDGFTIIDANGDGKKWGLSSDAAMMGFNSSMDMDDWLITPPMKLEAGKKYLLSLDARANSNSMPERFEVKLGTANTVAGMTQTIIAATDVTSKVFSTYTGIIAPTTTGSYFIGIHGMSDADQWNLYVDNFKVGSAAVPGAATNLTVTPDAAGDLKAAISFNAPSQTAGGDALSSLTKVELLRDGAVVNTFNSPTAGAALTFNDVLETGGTYTYTVVAYNGEGKGLETSASAFVGVNKPAAPENVTIKETANLGEVTITWSPVTTDVNGGTLPAGKVSYVICVANGNNLVPVTDDQTETTITFNAIDEGDEQALVYYYVVAQTTGGIGYTATDMIPVGPAYEGMAESFPDGTLSYELGITSIKNSPSWQILSDDSFEDLTSQDLDNGFIGMQAQYLEDKGGIFTGKVSLAGMVNPSLSFYTYCIAGESKLSDNAIEVLVREVGAADYTLLKSTNVAEVCDNQGDTWGRCFVDLAAYNGKTIQVMLTAECTGLAFTFFDNIKIGSAVDNDLKAAAITAPARVNAGSTYTVDVTVANEGMLKSAAYTVDLFANGTKVDTKQMEALESGARAHALFECAMSAVATQPVEYHAVVNAAADDVPENNTTSTITVTPKVSSLPAPGQLTAVAGANGGVQLTWNEPNLEGGVPEEVTESFEEAESFAQEFEGWTFVDGDQSAVGGFQGVDVPGITAGSSLASFFVFDTEAVDVNQTFDAHSGSKYLAALFRYDDGTTDDWAISPVLDGSAQTVSFYARSYSAQYPEKLRVLYSTGSTATADFVEVKAAALVPGEWTLYEVDLPAGAKYFAINSCGTGSFMLMIDDVTFTQGNATAELALVGYNVYRDGLKLNAEPVEDTAHLDLEGLAAHKYQVTALYDVKGESAGSNEASLTEGIADITDGVTISTEKGLIIVDGAEGKLVTVVALDGKVLYSAKGNAKVAVAQGVYLVKADKHVAKVLVK